MDFRKFPSPLNFRYVDRWDPASGEAVAGRHRLRAGVGSYEDGVWNVRIDRKGREDERPLLIDLTPPPPADGLGRLAVGPDLSLCLTDEAGEVILQSEPGMAFGVCGEAFAFVFRYEPFLEFFGLGQKLMDRFEYGPVQTRFWNVDAVGDHPEPVWRNGPTDPYYVSIPYLAIRRAGRWLGLLLENVSGTSIDTGVDPSFLNNMEEERRIVFAAEAGVASLWILEGPSLPELTRKLTRLTGAAPRPPLWSLGYHQCRWGYRGEADLEALDRQMVRHRIPNDGLWLDIDYMRGYRVFTTNPGHFPSGVPAVTAALAAKGRRVVPILDPGVKRDPGFDVYRDGRERGVFCQTPEGSEYVGVVWPGLTVFPDYTLPEARDWWAGYAERFRRSGFGGAWVDMNDPSTGAVSPEAMRFRHGADDHVRWRNEYALGMQMATVDGFRRAVPDERPFIVSRSGSIGTPRYSAIWNGDSVSNRFYLRAAIPQALNLGLSGVAFHGNDIGGFLGDCDAGLMVDWTKACFLFPFFRNHTTAHTREQEPWAYGAETLAILRRYIRLRYRLLPYLYQLFLQHESEGDPIVRPLDYHYELDESPIGDQFLVGADLLQAPFVNAERARRVLLPGDRPWFDLRSGVWTEPGEHGVWDRPDATPIYAREGAIVPGRPDPQDANAAATDLGHVAFHVFANPATESAIEYRWDDGLSFAYRDGNPGAEGRARVAFRWSEDGTLDLDCAVEAQGPTPLRAEFVVYGAPRRIRVGGAVVASRKATVAWAGAPIAARVVAVED